MSESGNHRSARKGRKGVEEVRSDEGAGVGDGLQVARVGWSVTLPLDMPSLNAYMRWHFRKQKSWRERIEQYIFVLGSPLPKYECPVSVTITRFYGHRKRAYDTDNLYAAAKPILDALKSPRGRSRHGLSVILEDNPEYCHLKVQQEKSKDKSTRIVVEVIDLVDSRR
jgi:hypothetical protein